MTTSSNRQEKLEKLEKKVLQLDALNKISAELTKTTDLDILLYKINEYAAKIVQGEAASILLIDKKKNELYFKSVMGKKSKEIKKLKIKIGEGIAGRVAQNGESLIVNDVSCNTIWKDDFDIATNFTTKSMICVPLFLEKDIIGIMEVINKKQGGQFSKDDEGILKSFANQVVIAMKNVNIIGDLNNYFRNTLDILIQAMENNSIAPKGHYMKVARYATQIGAKMGLKGEEFKNLYYASLLHDIGKIKNDTNIYSKTDNHPVVGAHMLKHIEIFKQIVPIVKHHHEHYDGSGFPSGLAGKNIPLGSRIIALVEDYLKIIYNKILDNIPENKSEIKGLFSFSEKKYDPDVIKVLKDIIEV